MNHATYKAAMRLAGARGGASRSPRKLAALARARQVRLDRIAARRAAAATVGYYIAARALSPEGYNRVNDEQQIESIYRTRAGDELVVFGLGQGLIVNPVGGGSHYHSMDIAEFLALPNESDWIKKEDVWTNAAKA